MGLLVILLIVLFVGLKLTGFISWSWFLVLAPIPVYILCWFVLVLIAIAAE